LHISEGCIFCLNKHCQIESRHWCFVSGHRLSRIRRQSSVDTVLQHRFRRWCSRYVYSCVYSPDHSAGAITLLWFYFSESSSCESSVAIHKVVWGRKRCLRTNKHMEEWYWVRVPDGSNPPVLRNRIMSHTSAGSRGWHTARASLRLFVDKQWIWRFDISIERWWCSLSWYLGHLLSSSFSSLAGSLWSGLECCKKDCRTQIIERWSLEDVNRLFDSCSSRCSVYYMAFCIPNILL
jgi:hypothetical protein